MFEFTTDKKDSLLKLANRVKELRAEKGLSQEQCYELTGINFSRIERGVADIRYTTILNLCEFFEIDIKRFFNS
ncbi:helix-turn-helix domain-containing protein [Tenacibaculum aiptasiae]|uniref:helix-turn-helix domain-containing protein n=1 Tax=Tenacibaculum aiptasiae TaxID=426481 RepID=UPI00232DA751|nr:helix-turn-helix transcriptional regulator [Tenacibaculum aiptasiae]